MGPKMGSQKGHFSHSLLPRQVHAKSAFLTTVLCQRHFFHKQLVSKSCVLERLGSSFFVVFANTAPERTFARICAPPQRQAHFGTLEAAKKSFKKRIQKHEFSAPPKRISGRTLRTSHVIWPFWSANANITWGFLQVTKMALFVRSRASLSPSPQNFHAAEAICPISHVMTACVQPGSPFFDHKSSPK